MMFEGRDLYVTLVEKVAALGFSLVRTTRLSMGISASVTPRWKPFYC